MGVTRVNHTGISVTDMERSLGFYRDVLGLELVMDMDVARHAGLDAVVGRIDPAANNLIGVPAITSPGVGQIIDVGAVTFNWTAEIGRAHV